MLWILSALAALLAAASATTAPPPPSSSTPTPTPTFHPFNNECFDHCIDTLPTPYPDLASFCPEALNNDILWNCMEKSCYIHHTTFENSISDACDDTFRPWNGNDSCLNICLNSAHGTNLPYTDMQGLCAHARDDELLFYCTTKRCYVTRDEWDVKLDEMCGAQNETFHPFEEGECLNDCVDQYPGRYTDIEGFCAAAKSDKQLVHCALKRCYTHEDVYDQKVDEVCGGPTTPTPPLISSTSPPYPCWNKTLCSKPLHPTHGTHTHPPPITITETSTHIETLTFCPDHHTCTGQTTTWTYTEGPTSCPPTVTCTCVLPGYPTLETCPPSVTCTGQTTEITEGSTVVLPSEIVPTVPANPTTTGPTEFQGAAVKAGAGLVAALVGVVVVL